MEMTPSHSFSLRRLLLTRIRKCSLWKRCRLNIALVILVVVNILFYTRPSTSARKMPEVLPTLPVQIREQISYLYATRGPAEEVLTISGLSGKGAETKYFTKVIDVEHYMYSATVNLDSTMLDTNVTNVMSVTNYTLNIVITSLDASNESYQCCIIFNNTRTPFVTPASLYFSYTNRSVYLARQYNCSVPINSLHRLPQKVTLATSPSCPTNPDNYVTILYPPRLPGRIALCGKVVYGNGRDPDEIIEWFEIQRILGVDKILIYDSGVTDNLTRVFRYYQNLGFLDVQPYEIPEIPKNRSVTEWAQFDEHETMAVSECRQRMGGYDYIISHDLDEMIMPRKHVTLKTLFRECKTSFPKAAAFFFHTEYFITTWQPTNPEEGLMVKRYRMATLPRWERYKYFYLPLRVLSSTIHYVQPISTNFSIERISPDVARLHHYRKCPKDDWGTCQVDNVVDDIIMKYTDLDQRVLKVRDEIWMPTKSHENESFKLRLHRFLGI